MTAPVTAAAGARIIAPFPFDSLPSLSRREIANAMAFREAASSFARADQIASAIESLTNEPIALAVRRVRDASASEIPEDAIAVALSPADSPSINNAIIVDVESALACALLTRALQQRAPSVIDASRAASSASPEIAGALAALFASILRRSHAGTPMRVIAAGPARALVRDLIAASANTAICASITIHLGREVFDGRVTVSNLRARETAAVTFSLEAEGALPIALPLVLSECVALRNEVALLRAGDVFLFGKKSIAGRVAIVAPTSERGLAGDLAEDGRLVLRTERIESYSWDPKDAAPATANKKDDMADSNRTTPEAGALGAALNEALESAPIVVRVELGVVEMSAREWAGLSSGDVIALGKKLGDPATLRVGGVEVARGELVQIDGEYGVRVVRRMTGGSP